MNKVEKKSFYSFLLLYLGSSLFFVLLSGYWYYSAQKNSLENNTYYKLEHLADTISALVINAHMSDTPLNLPKVEKNYNYKLIPKKENMFFDKNYFESNGYKVLVSTAPQEHLSIEYVVVKTDEYHKGLKKLQKQVFFTMIIVFTLIVIIAWLLSKLFMKPVHDKMNHIEQFIQDISHELNTPITALTMSAQRAMQKKVYDEKILINISISTKQLYNIYKSLAYLNFSSPKQELVSLNLKPILEQTIDYYAQLSKSKKIKIEFDIKDSNIMAVEERIELLFSNLISNAIKYSMPESKITIILDNNIFIIKDEGVGIAKNKLDDIFKLYERDSNIAGGFGIGLSIVKKICDELLITIDVKSELNKGSIFKLTW